MGFAWRNDVVDQAALNSQQVEQVYMEDYIYFLQLDSDLKAWDEGKLDTEVVILYYTIRRICKIIIHAPITRSHSEAQVKKGPGTRIGGGRPTAYTAAAWTTPCLIQTQSWKSLPTLVAVGSRTSWLDLDVERDMKHWPFEVKEKGGPALFVNHEAEGEEHKFSAEEISATVGKLGVAAEAYLGEKATAPRGHAHPCASPAPATFVG
ncbi:hypothetical protein BD779DRAFT_1685839 [Infundibulicybe gibba]|nr:hypothetical protein BD779DRAFT_1685839 [Infundibulicybe gibba]